MRARTALALGLSLLGLAACRASPQPSAATHASTVADSGEPRADCYACHARDYASAHQHEGVKPTRCAVCHLETGWHPTQRNHPWPLTGAHQQANCFACHSGKPPVFEDLPSACVDCHRADYDKSDFPGHDRFALTCGDCHGTAAWKPAKKPEPAGPKRASTGHAEREPSTRPAKPARHDAPAAAPQMQPAQTTEAHTPPPTAASSRQHPEAAFPITTGNHTDIDCKTCHDGPGRNSKDNTDCVQCHKRSRFDPRHTRVADYPVGEAPANFCVDCHTRGTRATR